MPIKFRCIKSRVSVYRYRFAAMPIKVHREFRLDAPARYIETTARCTEKRHFSVHRGPISMYLAGASSRSPVRYRASSGAASESSEILVGMAVSLVPSPFLSLATRVVSSGLAITRQNRFPRTALVRDRSGAWPKRGANAAGRGGEQRGVAEAGRGPSGERRQRSGDAGLDPSGAQR
jgi:hypothetical protein